MGDRSAIEWTNATWNPITGCTKIARGCDNCYAARFAERFRGTPGHPFERGFDLTLRPERISQPLSWKRPRMIFVNSMSDLFHKEIPLEFIDRVFEVMETADRHVFQVLTKRSSLMEGYLRGRYGRDCAPPHIWCGVSVEDQKASARIRHLRKAPARGALPVHRTAVGTDKRHRSCRNFLGHRRWGKRAEGPSHEGKLGPRYSRHLRAERGSLFFQAMGRPDAEIRRALA